MQCVDFLPRETSPALAAIARAVRAIIREHGVEPFQSKLLAWKQERDAWADVPRTDGDSEWMFQEPPLDGYRPDLPLDRVVDLNGAPQKLTPLDRYAVLAAVHDGIMPADSGISPWPEEPRICTMIAEDVLEAVLAGAAFWSMRDSIRSGEFEQRETFQDACQELATMLHEIRAELEAASAIVLSNLELEILDVLSQEHKAMLQSRLEAKTARTRNTLRHSLARLRSLNLVDQPRGPRGGHGITPRGRAFLRAAKVSAPTAGTTIAR